MKRAWKSFIWSVMTLWVLASGNALAGPKYFKDSYENLVKKAVALQFHGTLASFNANDETLKAAVDTKTGVLDGFFSMAATYGHDDVEGAVVILKNEARRNWDIKRFNKAVAQEALYNSEAVLKYLLNKDKTTRDPKFPALAPDHERKALALVVQAESAFDHNKYSSMRKLFYHALWLAYPVTSTKPFPEPKG